MSTEPAVSLSAQLLRVVSDIDSWVVSSPTIAFGILPVVIATVGFLFTTIVLEAVVQHVDKKRLVQWTSDATRDEMVRRQRAKVPLATQVKDCLYNLIGPPALVNIVTSAYLLPMVIVLPDTMLPATWMQFAADCVLMCIVNDFFLYWGHRIQHENKWLWENFHSLHHTINTPTPWSTIYIHPVDASLQGAIPIITAALAVQPSLLSFYAFVAFRVSENAVIPYVSSFMVPIRSFPMADERRPLVHVKQWLSLDNEP
eukprot:m.516076 g.516076  ORF g.516076 m.516076 type:complete len:257 (+) comp21927_c0_seq14:172-942(+)